MIRTAIETGLASAANLFRDNALAYLALTSKVENPLRDALAIDLHEKLRTDGFLVAREWRKKGFSGSTDIAILRSSRPAALIECKASYSYDAFGKPYPMESVVQDIEKARNVAGTGTEIFVLLFVTHSGRNVNKSVQSAVKYSNGINRAIKTHGGPASVLNAARSSYASAFSGNEFGLVTTGEIDAGQAFGIPVLIDYWLAEPKSL